MQCYAMLVVCYATLGSAVVRRDERCIDRICRMSGLDKTLDPGPRCLRDDAKPVAGVRRGKEWLQLHQNLPGLKE